MPDELPSHVKLLSGVGVALSNWSMVELQMCAIFDIVSDMRNPTKARTLFDGIISFEVRLSILDRMVNLEALDENDLALWKRLVARMSKLYKKRHEVAHFTVISEGSDNLISPFMTWNAFHTDTHKRLSAAQVAERADKFSALATALIWFKSYIVVQRSEGQLGAEILGLEPPLISHLRELESR